MIRRRPGKVGRRRRWEGLREKRSRSIFLLPSLLTTGNLFCGFLAMLLTAQGRYTDAAEVNERNTVRIQGETARVTMVQIAGVVARRIVCRVAAGDKVVSGQRIGLIRFGSRTDCYMPRTTAVGVAIGDRVTGGVTVLGTLP